MATDTTSKKRKSASATGAKVKKPRRDLSRAHKQVDVEEEELKKAAKEHLLSGRREAVTASLPKKSKTKAKKAAPSDDHIPLPPSDSEDSSANEEIDDQTAALLKGFESSSSEDEADTSAPASAVSKPSSTAVTATANASAPASSSVVYVGRIPHGFYEHQMRSYFSQFGEITNLRLSRNRRTGASKHFAFIEFTTPEVARIVSATMDNYLVFGHLLKVKVVPATELQGRKAQLFKGAGRRFKKVPWNRIEMNRVKSTDREGWEKRVNKEKDRREEKLRKLKELGYEFDAPALKEVEEVPKKIKEGETAKPADDVADLETVEQTIQTIDNGNDERRKKAKKKIRAPDGEMETQIAQVAAKSRKK